MNASTTVAKAHGQTSKEALDTRLREGEVVRRRFRRESSFSIRWMNPTGTP